MRRLIVSVASVTALLVTSAPAAAQPVPGNPLAGTTDRRFGGPVDLVGLDFQVINVASRRCLTVAGAATTDNATLVQAPCATAPAYRWRFRPASFAGAFQILNVRSNRCLSTSADVRAVQYRCDDHAARHWRLVDSVGDTANVRSLHSGRCLTIARSGVAVQSGCDDGAARRWTVRLLSVPFLGSPR